jgi:hypothetical protein
MQTRRRLIQIGLRLQLVGILIYLGWSNGPYLKVRWGPWTDNRQINLESYRIHTLGPHSDSG